MKKLLVCSMVIAILASAGIAISAEPIIGTPQRDQIATTNSAQLTGFVEIQSHVVLFPSVVIEAPGNGPITIEYSLSTNSEVISGTYEVPNTLNHTQLGEIECNTGVVLNFFIRATQNGALVNKITLYAMVFDVEAEVPDAGEIYNEGYNNGYSKGLAEGQEVSEALKDAPTNFFQGIVEFLDSFMEIGVGVLTIRSLLGLLFVSLLVVSILKVVRG